MANLQFQRRTAGSRSAGHRLTNAGAVPLIRALRPLGEAAFNQGSARSSSEVLDKVSAAAERETPLSCNLASAQEVGSFLRGKPHWILGKA